MSSGLTSQISGVSPQTLNVDGVVIALRISSVNSPIVILSSPLASVLTVKFNFTRIPAAGDSKKIKL